MPADNVDKLLTAFVALEKRVNILEAKSIQAEAATTAALHCLRDYAKVPHELLKQRFDHYFAELHEMLLIQVEDADPWKAARLDLRTPEDQSGAS